MDASFFASAEVCEAVILTHWKSSPHRGVCAEPMVSGRGVNPACGDVVQISLTMRDGAIVEARHESAGCAASMAAASLVCGGLAGRGLAEARLWLESVARCVRGEEGGLGGLLLGEAEALGVFSAHAGRRECASVAVRVAAGLLAVQHAAGHEDPILHAVDDLFIRRDDGGEDAS